MNKIQFFKALWLYKVNLTLFKNVATHKIINCSSICECHNFIFYIYRIVNFIRELLFRELLRISVRQTKCKICSKLWHTLQNLEDEKPKFILRWERKQVNSIGEEKKELFPSFPEQAQGPRAGQLLTKNEQPKVRLSGESNTQAFCWLMCINATASSKRRNWKEQPRGKSSIWPKAVTQLQSQGIAREGCKI